MEKEIFTKVIGPSTSDKILVFFHDFWNYHKYYLNLANYLTYRQQDLAVLLLDLPGFGLSPGTRGHIDNLDLLSSQLSTLISGLGEKKIYLGGMGIGALLSLRLTLKEKKEITGLILCNPFFAFENTFAQKFSELCYFMDGPLGKIKIPHPLLEDSHHEERENDALLSSSITLRTFGQVMLEGKRAVHWANFVNLPVITLLSGRDPLYSPTLTDQFMEHVPKEFLTEMRLEQEQHWLFQSDESEDIMGELNHWLKSNK